MNRRMTIEETTTVLVRSILEQAEQIAVTAVREAFQGEGRASSTSSPKRTSGRRRTSSETNALGSRLFKEILASPGSPMKILAPKVGATPRELNLPARTLAAAGKIKTTGARSETRYFPMGRAEA